MDLQTAYDLRVAEELAGEQIRREVAPVPTSAETPVLAAAA
jgi:antitoxin HigA-1